MGSRKIATKLQDKGYPVGRKIVRLYIREMEIYAVYPKPNPSNNTEKGDVVLYLLRYKTAIFLNQHWSIDITCIEMYHHHMYLVKIIDWYSSNCRMGAGKYPGNISCFENC